MLLRNDAGPDTRTMAGLKGSNVELTSLSTVYRMFWLYIRLKAALSSLFSLLFPLSFLSVNRLLRYADDATASFKTGLLHSVRDTVS